MTWAEMTEMTRAEIMKVRNNLILVSDTISYTIQSFRYIKSVNLHISNWAACNKAKHSR